MISKVFRKCSPAAQLRRPLRLRAHFAGQQRRLSAPPAPTEKPPRRPALEELMDLRTLAFKPYFGTPLTSREALVPFYYRFLRPAAERTILPVITGHLWRKYQSDFHSFTVEGQKYISRDQPGFFAAHHSSIEDPFYIETAIHHYGRLPWILAKEELFEKLIYRLGFVCGGILPFDRNETDLSRTVRQLRRVVSLMKGNQSVLFYPSGTVAGNVSDEKNAKLNRLLSDVEPDTGLLRPGPPFMAAMAYAANIPVTPVGHVGPGAFLPPEIKPLGVVPPHDPKQFDISLRFGKPIDVVARLKELSGDQFEKLPARERKALLALVTNEIMSAISRLVDFSREVVPYKVPMQRVDYEQIRKHERWIAERCLLHARGDLRTLILTRHQEQTAQAAKRAAKDEEEI